MNVLYTVWVEFLITFNVIILYNFYALAFHFFYNKYVSCRGKNIPELESKGT